MSSQHFMSKFDKVRDLTKEERSWIDKLLEIKFHGRDELLLQLENVKVIGACFCGCKTIDIEVNPISPKSPVDIRVPVQMIVYDGKSAPIIFYLHVVDGYISELEVLKADSKSITAKINIDNAEVSITT